MFLFQKPCASISLFYGNVMSSNLLQHGTAIYMRDDLRTYGMDEIANFSLVKAPKLNILEQ